MSWTGGEAPGSGNNESVAHADLTLTAWHGFSDAAAGRVAEAVARETGTVFAGLSGHTYAGRDGRVAFFERDGIRFALVPGATADLGHDAARFAPTARQCDDFAEAAADYGIAVSLRDFVVANTSPARRVTLPALLVAVRSEESESLVATEFDGGDGHRWVLGGLAARGLRPPAPDEWEWACGAGATTLFRWGDEYPEGEPDGDVPLLTDPNLFGLIIGDDPYRSEFTTDPAVLCGGDGGSALCGGSGAFLSWLAVATAFRDPEQARVIAEGELTEEVPVRPVLAIP